MSFRRIGNDALFWRALAGNLVVPLVTVVIELVSGLGLALLLAGRLPARRLLVHRRYRYLLHYYCYYRRRWRRRARRRRR